MEHQYDEKKNVHKKYRWEKRDDGKASAKLLLGLKKSNEIDQSHDRPCLGIHIPDIGEEIHDDMSANSLQLGMLGEHSNMSYGLHNKWRNDGLPGVESYMVRLFHDSMLILQSFFFCDHFRLSEIKGEKEIKDQWDDRTFLMHCQLIFIRLEKCPLVFDDLWVILVMCDKTTSFRKGCLPTHLLNLGILIWLDTKGPSVPPFTYIYINTNRASISQGRIYVQEL
ncbi:hypothetical protein IV203_008905 [Nitzschia inconspicua]|uniref:Uncharacterized protein n=1 Tax=Nitzschia inconspicua TaxID=303405 RepID=A0A9K3PMI0_9STRA|nr:hypothetical protein IV203_008905 [Nitzschia inconspicua]